MTVISLIVTAFITGGFFGLVGMACMAYGHKTHLIRENKVMRERLEFLEMEMEKKRYTMVPDPKPHVHALVN